MIILPKRLRRRQLGFFLNPFRFAGTTQSGAFSTDGAATKTMAGASIGAANLSSDGAGVLTAEDNNVTSGAGSMAGAAVLTMDGASNAASAISADGAGVATASSSGTEITCDAADFDGTNDNLRRTSTFSPAPSSSTKQGIVSIWFNRDVAAVSHTLLDVGVGSSYRTQVILADTDELTIRCSTDGGTTICLEMSTTSDPSTGAWHHLLASWDFATATEHLYIDGVSNVTVPTRNNTAIDYSGINDNDVGALGAGSFRFNGGMAEVYFAIGQYLDFAAEANRLKFRSSGGKPMSLGTDGSLPTGTVPTIYLHLDDGETANNFAINRTAAGNFTVTGSLDTYPSSPSD